jgi:hypothetical protein
VRRIIRRSGLLHEKRRLFTAKNFKGGKPMKKFLSLVLALVMTMSLVTISAGAKDFTDGSSITYQEAVDVISTIGVVDGYTDGSFNPTATLTRGAAAKIICNLRLGPTVAAELSADTAPYSDVPVDSTFAGYIAYCQKEGIISGYADGSFRPSGTLTSYAFMKMLLGALGYDSSIEGYTGNNWSVAVAKRALNIGLNDGLKTEFNGVSAVTREEAALYSLNTLKADLVEYGDKITVSNTDGSSVTVGNSSASSVKWANRTQNTADGNIYSDGIIQFAEEYFNKLDLYSGDDDFNRPATTWYFKGVKVGTYAETPDLTYSADVKVNTIYNDLKMTSKDTTATIYVDGLSYYDGTSDLPQYVNVAKSNDAKLTELGSTTLKSSVGDGTIVEVYRDDDTNHVDIVVISVWGGKISAVKDATAKKDAYVEVEVSTDSTKYPTGFTKGSRNEYETTDFAEDDVVAFTYSYKANAIKSMYKLESQDGSLTKRTVGKSLQLGDTTYKYSKNYAFEDITEAGLTNKSDYVVYLDNNGLALWITEADFSVSAYALVEKISCEDGNNVLASPANLNGNNTSIWDGNRAKLLFADGTEKTVTLDKSYVSNSKLSIVANDIVRYKVTDSGEYKLTLINDKDHEQSVTNFAIKNKALSGTVNQGTLFDADSKTSFVVKDGDDWKVYTGIKNAPTVASGTAVIYAQDGVAKIVFVTSGTISNTSKDVTFLAARSVSKLVTESDTAEYYLYNAVVKGEITTVMVAKENNGNRVVVNGHTSGTQTATNVILNTTSYDSDDIMTSGSWTQGDVTYKSFGGNGGVKKVTGSTTEIKLDGKVQSLASSCAIYVIDWDGNIESATLSDVKTNTDSIGIYTMDDGEITNLFIQLPKE